MTEKYVPVLQQIDKSIFFSHLSSLAQRSDAAFHSIQMADVKSGIICFHLYKATRYVNAIQLLAVNSHVKEAVPLLRVLTELCINALWMFNKRSDHRTTRYREFHVVQKQRLATGLLRTKGKGVDREKVIEGVRAKSKIIDDLKAKYNEGDHFKDGWSGVSIAEMAKELKLEWLYHQGYVFLSEITHSNSSSIHQYFSGTKDGKYEPVLEDADYELKTLLLRTSHAYAEIVRLFNEKMGTKIEVPGELEKQLSKSKT